MGYSLIAISFFLSFFLPQDFCAYLRQRDAKYVVEQKLSCSLVSVGSVAEKT